MAEGSRELQPQDRCLFNECLKGPVKSCVAMLLHRRASSLCACFVMYGRFCNSSRCRNSRVC